MVFRSKLQLSRFEAAKRRRLKKMWQGGFERVEIPSTEMGRNQELSAFTESSPKCIYCKGTTKFNGRATNYSVFFRCRECEKIMEVKR